MLTIIGVGDAEEDGDDADDEDDVQPATWSGFIKSMGFAGFFF